MFAIIPAAGHSRRMGQPKLLLPWRQTTVIEHVIQTWLSSQIRRVVIVVRSDDAEMISRCGPYAIDVVTPPTPPADMKQSILFGIDHIECQYAPTSDDSWLFAPADMPTLEREVIDQLIEASHRFKHQPIVPSFDGKHGHPVLLPWSLVSQVRKLDPTEGLNRLVESQLAKEIMFPAKLYPRDLDVPSDYTRLRPEPPHEPSSDNTMK